jgi:hypothetical protein
MSLCRCFSERDIVPRSSNVPSPKTGMLRERFTSPSVESNHGLSRAKRRNAHNGNQICMIYACSSTKTKFAIETGPDLHR